MKIAILSDIHGNNCAFNAVLNSIDRLGITKLFVLGDIVGYYYHPAEILSSLMEQDFCCVKGNHESFLLDCVDNPATLPAITQKYGHGIQTAIETLTARQLDFIRGLPATLSLTLDGRSFLLCHGSPESTDEYLYPDTEKTVFENYAALSYDVVLMGHTHYPFYAAYGRTVFVNPGSVGQSRVAGGIASWCVFDTDNGAVSPKATAYDISPVLAEVNRLDAGNDYLGAVLRR